MRAHSDRDESGFSFVEILIVMAIIAVLAGLTLAALALFARERPRIDTRTRIGKLVAMANDLRHEWGAWPPTSIVGLHDAAGGVGPEIRRAPNDENEGAESLYQAMHWPGFGGDPRLNDANDLSNTDGDEADRPLARGRGLDEVKDGWKDPIIYIPHTEYAKAWAKPVTYRRDDGRTVEVRPYRNERGFENPNSCQIFSLGPDGEQGTEDDIKGW